jgi:hypothetical protein
MYSRITLGCCFFQIINFTLIAKTQLQEEISKNISFQFLLVSGGINGNLKENKITMD